MGCPDHVPLKKKLILLSLQFNDVPSKFKTRDSHFMCNGKLQVKGIILARTCTMTPNLIFKLHFERQLE